MNNRMETQRKQPTIVAKLMGLDSLPVQNSASVVGENIPKTSNIHNVYTIGKAIREHHQQGNINSSRIFSNSRNISSQVYQKEKLKDVHEVQKKNSNDCDTRNRPSSMGKCSGNPYEKRMALVHQKFMEAKRLARDKNILQSREFQDALDVLSLNRDLFLRFLEEPYSWFSNHFQDVQPNPLTDSKCITVLKPSKMMAPHIKEPGKRDNLCVEVNAANKVRHRKTDTIANQTRIVILKPNPGRSYDMRDKVPFPSSSRRYPEREHTYSESGDHEARCSREAAREITRRMQEKLGIYRRDEILLPSVQPNRYGDGRVSSYRPLSEFMEEEWSDCFSQMKTPRHSQDYTDRCVSPCSLSSLGQSSSHSPESSVTIEAKKHISERWVMLSSDGINQRESRAHSSNTLGRMLADPEAKPKEGSTETHSIFHDRTCTGERDQRRSHVGIGEMSPSKSFRVSRSIQAPNSERSDCQPAESNASNVVNTQKTAKSMLKGRILSLFSSKDKISTSYHSPPPSARVLNKVPSTELAWGGARTSNDLPRCTTGISEGPQHNHGEMLRKNLSSTVEHDDPGGGTPPSKEAQAFEIKRRSENSAGNAEQPSPVSVLQATFDEEEPNTGSSATSEMIAAECFRAVSRIPSIESVARSLPWDEDDVAGANDPNCLLHSAEDMKEEEWMAFVQKLLSSSPLGDETSSVLLGRLHSLDSPLDPALLDKHVEPKREGAKSRQRRSNQRLLFDCTNFILLEIIRDELANNLKLRIVRIKEQNEEMDVVVTLTEKVLMKLKEWFSVDGKGTSGHGENIGLMVDSVGGEKWEETMRAEVVEMGREMERHVLDELVREFLEGFILGCF